MSLLVGRYLAGCAGRCRWYHRGTAWRLEPREALCASAGARSSVCIC